MIGPLITGLAKWQESRQLHRKGAATQPSFGLRPIHAALRNSITTSRRIRLSSALSSALAEGGGRYLLFAGKGRECRDTNERPCRCANAETIRELRTNVPRMVESPTT